MTFVTEVKNTPNNHVVNIPDSYGRPAFVKDNQGAGDIVGLFWDPDDGFFGLYNVTTDTWIMDNVANWYGPGDSNNGTASIAQDSAGKIHYVWMQVNFSSVAYARLAPSRDGNGHVTGFAWEVNMIDGPVMGDPDWRLHLIVGKDGAGSTESLILAIGELGAHYAYYNIVVAKTLAPVASSWKKLDGTTGRTLVLDESSTDKYTDSGGTLRTIIAAMADIHMCEIMIAQHPVDYSIHFFMGGRITEAGKGIDTRVWRYAASGSNWALDAGVTGLRLCRNAANDRPYVGSVAVSGDRIWLAYFDPQYGLRVVHSENTYGNSSGVDLPLAYTSDDGQGQTACGLSVSAANHLWICWVQDFLASAKVGYWNGSSWNIADPGLATDHKDANVWAWGGVAVGQRDGVTALCARNPSGKYLPYIVGRTDAQATGPTVPMLVYLSRRRK